MQPSNNCISLIKQFEGFRSKPYLCPANVATIGYGTTIYPNNVKVQLTDNAITEQQATEYLIDHVNKSTNKLNQFIKIELNQCQYDALCDFVYNVGLSAFANSTLLKIVNNNPNDFTNIQINFMKWVYANSKIITGLQNRRKAEYNLYASK
jgi:lysozyme